MKLGTDLVGNFRSVLSQTHFVLSIDPFGGTQGVTGQGKVAAGHVLYNDEAHVKF